jgi:hypothetical protein
VGQDLFYAFADGACAAALPDSRPHPLGLRRGPRVGAPADHRPRVRPEVRARARTATLACASLTQDGPYPRRSADFAHKIKFAFAMCDTSDRVRRPHRNRSLARANASLTPRRQGYIGRAELVDIVRANHLGVPEAEAERKADLLMTAFGQGDSLGFDRESRGAARTRALSSVRACARVCGVQSLWRWR